MSRAEPMRWLAILIFITAPLPVFSQAPPAANPGPNATDLRDALRLPAADAPILPAAPTAAPAPRATATPEEIGDSDEARHRYQAAIAAYKSEPHPTAAVWNKMGIAYQMMFNLRDATRCYRESLRLDQKGSMVYNNLGTVYDSLKEYRKAEKMYHKALKADPNAPVALKNLGTNLLVQHKYSKGWKAYEEAMRLDPTIFEDLDSPTVFNPTSIQERGAMNYFMARGCVRMGQTACALEYLRMAVSEGYITIKKVTEDADFASLRDNPAFKRFVAEQKGP